MGSVRTAARTLKQLLGFLRRRQKVQFGFVLVILVVSAGLAQLTPLAIEYLTDGLLAAGEVRFARVAPVLLAILAANVVNEIIKVVRRLLVEDTATSIEKCARQRATEALPAAPLPYFRGHMTGNIHGRLNRNLEGTSKLIKLVFMDFAPAVAGGLAAIGVIFAKLPLPVAGARDHPGAGQRPHRGRPHRGPQRLDLALRAQGATVLSIARRLAPSG